MQLFWTTIVCSASTSLPATVLSVHAASSKLTTATDAGLARGSRVRAKVVAGKAARVMNCRESGGLADTVVVVVVRLYLG